MNKILDQEQGILKARKKKIFPILEKGYL